MSLKTFGDGNFEDATLEEAWIIVPLSLRVTGYGPPSIPAYPDRPTIFLEGQMGGEGWDGNVHTGTLDIRITRGSVCMLAVGSVRWSLVSSP